MQGAHSRDRAHSRELFWARERLTSPVTRGCAQLAGARSPAAGSLCKGKQRQASLDAPDKQSPTITTSQDAVWSGVWVETVSSNRHAAHLRALPEHTTRRSPQAPVDAAPQTPQRTGPTPPSLLPHCLAQAEHHCLRHGHLCSPSGAARRQCKARAQWCCRLPNRRCARAAGP